MRLHDVVLHKDGDDLVGRGRAEPAGTERRPARLRRPAAAVGLAERDRAPREGIGAGAEGERAASVCSPTAAGWSCDRRGCPSVPSRPSRCSTIRAYTSRASGRSCGDASTRSRPGRASSEGVLRGQIVVRLVSPSAPAQSLPSLNPCPAWPPSQRCSPSASRFPASPARPVSRRASRPARSRPRRRGSGPGRPAPGPVALLVSRRAKALAAGSRQRRRPSSAEAARAAQAPDRDPGDGPHRADDACKRSPHRQALPLPVLPGELSEPGRNVSHRAPAEVGEDRSSSPSPATPTGRSTPPPAARLQPLRGLPAHRRASATTSTSTSATSIYSDSAVPGRAGRPHARRTSGPSTGSTCPIRTCGCSARRPALYSHWDDHEWIDDFSIPQFGQCASTSPARRRSSTTARSSITSKLGLYRSFRWGKNLEIFFLDERSFRSLSAEADPACRNPATGQPRPGCPSFRRACAPRLIPNPAFANFPTAAQCQAVLNDPNRTMLGKDQLAKLRERDQALEGDVQGDHERGPDPEDVLRPVRPLGGLQRRARGAAHASSRPTSERRVPHHRPARDAHQRRSANDVPEEGASKDTGMLDFVTGPSPRTPSARTRTRSSATRTRPRHGHPLQGAAAARPRHAVRLTRRRQLRPGERSRSKVLTVSPLDQNGQLVREGGTTPCAPVPDSRAADGIRLARHRTAGRGPADRSRDRAARRASASPAHRRPALTIGRLPDNELTIAERGRVAPPRAHRGGPGRLLGRGPRVAQRDEAQRRALPWRVPLAGQRRHDRDRRRGAALPRGRGDRDRRAGRGSRWSGPRRSSFTGDQLTLGRDRANDVVLEDPNVSRFHAEMRPRGDRIEVRDLASRNGTRVNGELVRTARAGGRVRDRHRPLPPASSTAPTFVAAPSTARCGWTPSASPWREGQADPGRPRSASSRRAASRSSARAAPARPPF